MAKHTGWVRLCQAEAVLMHMPWLLTTTCMMPHADYIPGA